MLILLFELFDNKIPSATTVEEEVEEGNIQGIALEEAEADGFPDTEVEVEVRIGKPLGWPSPNPMIWFVEDRGEPISG